MNPLLIILIALLVISGLGLIIFILLHSGKGTGISDMIASSVYSSQTGTSIVEKNLDRITIIFAVVFLLSLIALMIVYPIKFLKLGLGKYVRFGYINHRCFSATTRRSGGTADTQA